MTAEHQEWRAWWDHGVYYEPPSPEPEPVPGADPYIPEEDEGPDNYCFHPRATRRWCAGTGHDPLFAVTSDRYLEDTTP